MKEVHSFKAGLNNGAGLTMCRNVLAWQWLTMCRKRPLWLGCPLPLQHSRATHEAVHYLPANHKVDCLVKLPHQLSRDFIGALQTTRDSFQIHRRPRSGTRPGDRRIPDTEKMDRLLPTADTWDTWDTWPEKTLWMWRVKWVVRRGGGACGGGCSCQLVTELKARQSVQVGKVAINCNQWQAGISGCPWTPWSRVLEHLEALGCLIFQDIVHIYWVLRSLDTKELTHWSNILWISAAMWCDAARSAAHQDQDWQWDGPQAETKVPEQMKKQKLNI